MQAAFQNGNYGEGSLYALGAFPGLGKVGNVGGKGVNIIFKTTHVTQHLKDLNLTSKVVESAIQKQIQIGTKGASETGQFWGRTVIEGQKVEYRAFTLPNGTINVGTYFKVD